MQTEAMVLERHGGPEVLEKKTIDLGELGAREVRVKVHAVAMNHMDLWVRRGGPAFKLQYPHRLGCDIAGTVEALGAGARGITVGARVLLQPGLSDQTCAQCLAGRDNLCKSYKILGENAQGGYSRHVHVPDVNVVAIPDSLSFEAAAAAPLVTLTAWQMIFEKGQVAPGQTVVVHAAGSGVSTVAIQLAKLAGARVIATTSQRSKVERAKSLGADEVIVTSEQDYVAELKRLTSRNGADVILDHLGGELLEKAIVAVAWGGRIVTCGATAGFAAKIDLRQIFFRQVSLLGSTMGSKGLLLKALPLIASGKIAAPIDRVLSLWEAREAHRALEAREVFGKVVLTVD
jgi:NADPH:quinone reductase-like Zn-dependent oxidoreductase